MITGYNTDVRHRGLVFHVQTEDKGLTNPCVESLVYVGGQILKRTRSDYSRLVKTGEGKDAIAALIERQHRQVITEIRTGKLDEQVERQLGSLQAAPAEEAEAESLESGPRSATPSLDQVILEYLTSEAEREHLVLVMDSASELDLGSEVVLAFEATSSVGGRAMPHAAIEVKLISTASEPTLLASGTADETGRLALRVRIPDLQRGSSALIVSATSSVGSAEIRHLL
jgi:hypothetical protein